MSGLPPFEDFDAWYRAIGVWRDIWLAMAIESGHQPAEVLQQHEQVYGYALPGERPVVARPSISGASRVDGAAGLPGAGGDL